MAGDSGPGAETEASDLAGADVDIVGAGEVVVVGAAEEAESIGENFECAFSEHESIEAGAFLEDSEDEVLFFEPVNFGELILFGDGDQVFHGHALEFGNIDPVIVRRCKGFRHGFAVLRGIIAAVCLGLIERRIEVRFCFRLTRGGAILGRSRAEVGIFAGGAIFGTAEPWVSGAGVFGSGIASGHRSESLRIKTERGVPGGFEKGMGMSSHICRRLCGSQIQRCDLEVWLTIWLRISCS